MTASRSLLLLAFASLAACKTLPVAQMPVAPASAALVAVDPGQWKVLDYARAPMLDDVINALADRRVVFVGESHERYDHHLTQLKIIEGLHARGVPLAIGLEMIQRPFQQALDAYVAGRIGETEMLRRTEYFERWKFDFRLYRPIFLFAREQGIPLVALNAPVEVTKAIGKLGLDGLSPELRRQLPRDFDRDVAGYRERLEAVFSGHPGGKKKDFEHFIDVQLAWDETMAETAANYLRAHPRRSMVVLAGAGHVVEGTGIPQRLERRLDAPMATVLQTGSGIDLSGEPADYVVLSPPLELPPAGLIGVVLEQADRGMKIISIAEGSHAAAAGVRKNDRVIEVNGAPIATLGDIRLQLWNRKPGDTVRLGVLRGRDPWARRLDLDVRLK